MVIFGQMCATLRRTVRASCGRSSPPNHPQSAPTLNRGRLWTLLPLKPSGTCPYLTLGQVADVLPRRTVRPPPAPWNGAGCGRSEPANRLEPARTSPWGRLRTFCREEPSGRRPYFEQGQVVDVPDTQTVRNSPLHRVRAGCGRFRLSNRPEPARMGTT